MKAHVMKYVSALLLGGLLFGSGCANWGGYAGVDNNWRAKDVPQWEPGKTTAAEIATYLGPPSQLIPLHDETVFYYMREGQEGKALMLLIWNTGSQVTSYDRAIFFFDKEGLLKNFAYSNEELPYAPKKDK